MCQHTLLGFPISFVFPWPMLRYIYALSFPHWQIPTRKRSGSVISLPHIHHSNKIYLPVEQFRLNHNGNGAAKLVDSFADYVQVSTKLSSKKPPGVLAQQQRSRKMRRVQLRLLLTVCDWFCMVALSYQSHIDRGSLPMIHILVSHCSALFNSRVLKRRYRSFLFPLFCSKDTLPSGVSFDSTRALCWSKYSVSYVCVTMIKTFMVSRPCEHENRGLHKLISGNLVLSLEENCTPTGINYMSYFR